MSETEMHIASLEVFFRQPLGGGSSCGGSYTIPLDGKDATETVKQWKADGGLWAQGEWLQWEHITQTCQWRQQQG